MKKIIRVLLVVMLVMSMVSPAFATEGFVGSINDRPSPELAQMGTTPDGVPYYGVVRDAEGNIVMYLEATEIIVTPANKVEDATHLTDAEKDLFFDVYDDMKTGETDLSEIEGLTESVKAALGQWAEAHHMVVSEFFDIKVVGDRADEVYSYLDNGGTLTVCFNYAIPVEDHVEVMSYADTEWQLAVDVVNNDGSTLTVTFNHLCPAAVLVEADDIEGGEGGDEGQVPGGEGSDEQKPSEGPETGDDSNPLLWAGICVVAVAGIAVLVAKTRKKEQ